MNEKIKLDDQIYQSIRCIELTHNKIKADVEIFTAKYKIIFDNPTLPNSEVVQLLENIKASCEILESYFKNLFEFVDIETSMALKNHYTQFKADYCILNNIVMPPILENEIIKTH